MLEARQGAPAAPGGMYEAAAVAGVDPGAPVPLAEPPLAGLGRPFWLLWVGESITSLGTHLVQFALGVWIYQHTGSVLSFAGSLVASLLPTVLVMPVAASLVDRLERRRVIVVADCVAACMTLLMIYLLWRGQLQVVHLYAFAAVASVTNAFQEPAYQASVAGLLREDQLTRATGTMGISTTTLGIVAPTLAGALLAVLGLPGLMLLDLAAFVVGSTFIWRAFALARVPQQERGAASGLKAAVRDSFSNLADTRRFFAGSPALSCLLLYSVVQTAMLALASVMAMPLILSNHSVQSLGGVLTAGAAGALTGSLLMALLDNPRHRIGVILLCDTVLAACIAAFGLVDGVVAYGVLEFVACAAGAIVASCSYALWMGKVPATRHGSVLVLVGTLAAAGTSVVTLTAASLAEAVLKPALAEGGWAQAVAPWLGVQQGNEIALLFVLAGGLGLLVALGGFACKPLRSLR